MIQSLLRLIPGTSANRAHKANSPRTRGKNARSSAAIRRDDARGDPYPHDPSLALLAVGLSDATVSVGDQETRETDSSGSDNDSDGGSWGD